jgi:peptide/nickel transport system permease protein
MSDATQTELANANPLPVRARVWNRFAGIFWLSPTGAIGLFIILFFALLAIFSAWLIPHDPIAAYTDKVLHPPSAEFWFGTDGNGMDVFSRVIYGAKFGFGIAIPAVILSLVIGIPVGLIAGYRGGLLDEVLMRFVDGLRVFP